MEYEDASERDRNEIEAGYCNVRALFLDIKSSYDSLKRALNQIKAEHYDDNRHAANG